jgi:hypothetical protein
MRKLVGCSAARQVEGEAAGRTGGPRDHLSNFTDAHAIGIFALKDRTAAILFTLACLLVAAGQILAVCGVRRVALALFRAPQ